MPLSEVKVNPTADPNYTGASGGPISVRPDRSMATLFEGLANTVGTVAQGVDGAIQNNIKKDVYNLFDQEVGSQGVNVNVEKVAGADGTPFQAKELPSTITGQGKSLARLTQAFEEGRISDTYYYSRLEAGVRQLRAKYPGYRDEIDSMVSGVTGVTPANALRRAFLSDVESAQREAASQRNSYERFVESNMEHLSPDMIQDLEQGQLPGEGEFRGRVARRKSREEDIKAERASIALDNDRTGQRVDRATAHATKALSATFDNILEDAFGKVKSIQTSGKPPTPQELEALSLQTAALRVELNNGFDAMMNSPLVEGGTDTLASVINDPAKVKALREAHLAKLDTLEQAITDGNFGLLNLNKNAVAAMDSAGTRALLEKYPVFGVIQNVRAIGGGEVLNNLLIRNDANLLGEVNKAVNGVIAGRMMTGETTLVEGIAEVKATGNKDPNAYKALIESVPQILLDKTASPEVFGNTVAAVYGPEGRGLLAQFQPQERMKIFSTLASPDITNRMAELKGSAPAMWDAYRQTTEDWFSSVHRKDIEDTNRLITDSEWFSVTQSESGRYSLAMTQEGERYFRGRGIQFDAQGLPITSARNVVQEPIQRLNRGLDLMETILAVDGQTVADDLQPKLEALGLNVGLPKNEGGLIGGALQDRMNEEIPEADLPPSDASESAALIQTDESDLLTITPAKVEAEVASSGKTVVEIASNYLGVTERGGRETLSEFFSKTLGRNINPATTPWCAAFANAVLKEKGIKGTGSLLARSFLDFGEAVQEPQKGDIVVLSRGNSTWQGHVGFFMGYDDKGNVKILGGNQRDKVGVNAYNADRILGFRRPPGVATVSSMPSFKGTEIGAQADLIAREDES